MLLLREEQSWYCQPTWANYQVDFIYDNGVRTFSYNTTQRGTLQDTFVHGVSSGSTGDRNAEPPRQDQITWTEDEIQNLKMINHYAILDTIGIALNGSQKRLVLYGMANDTKIPVTLNGTTLQFTQVRSFYDQLTPFEAANDMAVQKQTRT